MGGARVAFALAAALLLHAEAARSQAPPPAARAPSPARVRLEPPACAAPPFDASAFASLLQIELREDGVGWGSNDADPREGAPEAWVAVEVTPCDARTREVALVLGSAATRKTSRRTVFVGDAPPPLRPRLLALAAAELVRAGWPEIAPSASVTVPPVVAPLPAVPCEAPPAPLPVAPPAPFRPAPPPPPARAHLSAGFEVRALVGHLHAEGGRLGASIAFSPRVPLRLTLDGGALAGSSFDRLGSVSVQLGSGALGLAGSFSISRAILEVGPEVELGGVWAQGHAFNAGVREESGSAFIAAASLAAMARAPLGDRLWLHAALRGGAVLRGVTLLAETREAGAVAGAMLGVRVGVGLDL